MVRTVTKLSFAIFLAASTVPAQAVEVLTNGDFSSGLTGWTSYTTANGTITEIPSSPPTAVTPQVAQVASFNVTGSGSSAALFLNAGAFMPPYGSSQQGGGVTQTFLTTGGLATFSANIAWDYTRTSNAGFGLMSVLLDGVVMDTVDFGTHTGPATLRDTLDFTADLTAGNHTISLQATRPFAPARGVNSEYFDNVSLNVVAPVPEPSTWAMLILGFAGIGFMAYRKKIGVTTSAA